ncbi:MAG: hypothetical protein LBQ12_06725 [Deltaproteobacteria bacterium]|nr:hypothetical protein [Deltaproteobacteria bacterium]
MLGQILACTKLPSGFPPDSSPPLDGEPSAVPRPDGSAAPAQEPGAFPPARPCCPPPPSPDPAEAPAAQVPGGSGDSPSDDWALAAEFLLPELPGSFSASLAAPVEGPLGVVYWHTPLEGTPRELAGLPPGDREAACRTLRRMAGEFSALGARLAQLHPDPRELRNPEDPGIPPHSRAAFGETRAAARLASRLSASFVSVAAGLRCPEKAFVVDGVPVLACWWKPQCPEDTVPDPFPEPWAAPEALALAPGFPAAPPYPAPAAPEECRAGFLRPALAALSAFLLALALFWLLSPGFSSASRAARGTDPMDGTVPGREEGLRAELDGLKGRYFRTLSVCRPDAPEPVPEETAPAIPEPERADGAPPSAGDAPRALEAAAPPAPSPPQRAPPDAPAPAPAPPLRAPPDAPARKPQRPRGPAPGSGLIIPAGAKDLSFLKGCWKSDANLLNIWGNHLVYIYCFKDGSGKASVRIEEVSTSVRRGLVCTTTGTAKLVGGRVRIDDRGATCQGGRSYYPVDVVCTPSTGGPANCVVHSSFNGSRQATRFTYVGSA